MPTLVATPGEAHVANDADESSSGNQHSKAVLPNLIKLVVKSFIIRNIAKLSGVIVVFF